jgi:hypothetical protein
MCSTDTQYHSLFGLSFESIKKTKERVKTVCKKINMPLISEIKVKNIYLFDTMSFLNDFIEQHKRFDGKRDTAGSQIIMFRKTN